MGTNEEPQGPRALGLFQKETTMLTLQHTGPTQDLARMRWSREVLYLEPNQSPQTYPRRLAILLYYTLSID